MDHKLFLKNFAPIDHFVLTITLVNLTIFFWVGQNIAIINGCIEQQNGRFDRKLCLN